MVLVHGGPTARWSDTFEPWGQLLAARGYAVLYPNVRGSTGYGHRFLEMNRGDWGGGDFKDVMAGVDALIARGIADPDRLGIGGWSYGGYMAAWAVTQTNRFKAAVSGAPVIDLASEFGTEDGSSYDEWFYGTPYERLDGFIRSSPITHVKNVKTPTLLLQGESDGTDPIGQSQQFYRGLKRYGVESDFVLYPREPHGLREQTPTSSGCASSKASSGSSRPFAGVITRRNVDVGDLIDAARQQRRARARSSSRRPDRCASVSTCRRRMRSSIKAGAEGRRSRRAFGAAAGARSEGEIAHARPASIDGDGADDARNRKCCCPTATERAAARRVRAEWRCRSRRAALSMSIPTNALMIRGDGIRVASRGQATGQRAACSTVRVGRNYGEAVGMLEGVAAAASRLVLNPARLAGGRRRGDGRRGGSRRQGPRS